MEVILALLITLPLKMGGYGLKAPVLNPRLDVFDMHFFTDGGVTRDDRFGDLVWQEAKLIVEYDSKAEHDDPKRDVNRSNALVANGWKVITVYPEHVLNRAKCDQLAGEIAAALGEKRRSLPDGYRALQSRLREDIFTACGTHCEENRNWVASESFAQRG